MEDLTPTVSRINEFTKFLGETSGEGYMEVVRDLIKFDPFNGHKFYIFSFMKLKDRQRYHQPRLTKPDPIPGGTLVHVDPMNPDYMKVCWTLPPQESFGLYKYKKAFADQFVFECINTFRTNPDHLCKPEPDDLNEEQCRELYKDLRMKIGNIKKKEKASV